MTRENIGIGVCWLLALYFLGAAVWPVFPPPDITQQGHYIFLILAVLFFLVPLAQKIEIFQFLSFQAKIQEVEEKVETAQAEIRHLQAIQATLTNSLSSVNSNANSVYVQLYNESKDAAFKGVGVPVPSVGVPDRPPAYGNRSSENDAIPRVEGAEPRMTSPRENLILLRTDLEKAMRLAVGKNLEIYKSRKEAKYLTSRQLAVMIVKQYPGAAKLGPSFDFFFNTSNAAAHGQNIPDDVIRDALVIGTALLNEVRKLKPVPAGSKEPEDA